MADFRKRRGGFNYRDFRERVKSPEMLLPAWMTKAPLQEWWNLRTLQDIYAQFKKSPSIGTTQLIVSNEGVEDTANFSAHFTKKSRICTFEYVCELMRDIKKMYQEFDFRVEHDQRGGGTIVLTPESYKIFTTWVYQEYPHALEILKRNGKDTPPTPGLP